MTLARWLLPLVSLLAVAWFTWFDVRGARTAPGPLHSAHAEVAALAGGARCEACHEPGAGVAADACGACHGAVLAQRGTGAGVHGALAPAVFGRCGQCHSEHHGDELALLPAHAWQRAGVADPRQYDHRHVAFALTGVHGALPCTACHEHADTNAPPPGGRFLGLTQRCTACHDDAHAGAFGDDCASCHGQERPWREVPHFGHERLPLVGAHARVACVACHAEGTERAVAAQRAVPAPPRACGDCHADPHGAAGTASALRLARTADCARCHAGTTWADARPDAARHEQLGFALHGVHAVAACSSCHGDAATAPRWRGEAPAARDCAACHEHAHGPELLAAAAGCADCHDAAHARFADGALTAAQHAAIGFVLAPPHGELACASCHRGEQRAERFPGRAAGDCAACHRDPHAGQFAQRDAWRQCTACHAHDRFRPPVFGLEAHAATAFPLAGAHQAVGCHRCHGATADGVRAFRGTPHACGSCHADPHGGAFDRVGLPRELAGQQGCARCHDVHAFTPVRTFDHALWTGHALTGAHTALACSACHPPGAGAGAPHLGPAAGRACAACHSDPHAGQFARAGATDCARCHEQGAWPSLRFDHAATRFALDATHAALACSACHQPQHGVVRYTPLGTKCGDCHRLGGDGGVRR